MAFATPFSSSTCSEFDMDEELDDIIDILNKNDQKPPLPARGFPHLQHRKLNVDFQKSLSSIARTQIKEEVEEEKFSSEKE
jgi:hypothetical protein